MLLLDKGRCTGRKKRSTKETQEESRSSLKQLFVYLFILQPNNSTVHKVNHNPTTKTNRDQLSRGDLTRDRMSECIHPSDPVHTIGSQ